MESSGDADRLKEELAAGKIPPDDVFDRLLPRALRSVSGEHWSPLEVVVPVARWLEAAGVRTVVDVGSGAGKFCIAGALVSRLRFAGVERRSGLVSAARDLARRLGVADRVRFLEGSLGKSPVPAAEAYYFFNPFAENIAGGRHRIDGQVDLGTRRHEEDVGAARDLLVSAPSGTYAVTFHGFGGRMPASYEEIRSERAMLGLLRFWRKLKRR